MGSRLLVSEVPVFSLMLVFKMVRSMLVVFKMVGSMMVCFKMVVPMLVVFLMCDSTQLIALISTGNSVTLKMVQVFINLLSILNSYTVKIIRSSRSCRGFPFLPSSAGTTFL